MPTTSYVLRDVGVAQSRTSYVLFGSNYSTDVDARYVSSRIHGSLATEAGRFATRSQALSAARQFLTANGGRSFGGHFAGPGPICPTDACEGRILSWVDERGHTFGPFVGSDVLGARVLSLGIPTAEAVIARRQHLLQRGPRTGGNPRVRSAVSTTVGGIAPLAQRFGTLASDLPVSLESVGVEFECVLPYRARSLADVFVHGLSGHGEIHHDGSIRTTGGEESREYTFWGRNLGELTDVVERLSSVGARQNSSCGLHVHVKPSAENLWKFATRFYHDGFLGAYHEWAASQPSKFTARESSRWCSVQPWSLSFVSACLGGSNDYGDRFRAVNLCSLQRHGFGTVEHRILPNVDGPAQFRAAVGFLVETSGRLAGASVVPVTRTERATLARCERLWGGTGLSTPESREAFLAARTSIRTPTPSGLPWAVAQTVEA